MSSRRFAWVGVPAFLASVGLAPALPAQTAPAGATEAAGTITAAELRTRVGVLAHDSMRGRDTPSPELRRTAGYVAEKFRAFGLAPGADGDYVQAYPLTRVRPGPAAAQRLGIRGPGGEHRLDPVRDFVSAPVGRSVDGAGPLVAVDPSGPGPALRGGVAVMRVGPDGLQDALRGVRGFVVQDGATGALIVLDAPPEYVAGVRRYFEDERVSLGEPSLFPAPVVIVSEAALPDALARALRRGGPLGGEWSATLHAEADIRREEGLNVIGWLEGSDPRLAREYVFFTAHMDHVGVGRPVDGDSIYNGADDNASGTAAILELAQAFAAAERRPRRSVVFMTVSGEEKGLWGSRWYSEHPTFPLERTVADLNIDMIGRNWSDTVVAIGREESSLGSVVDRVAAEHPELGLTVIDDPWPEERFYFRSDHYNFARRGVPILFFFSGVHEDYHAPSDELSEVDYEKTARIARLIFHTGWEVADAERRPRWDEDAYRRVVEEDARE